MGPASEDAVSVRQLESLFPWDADPLEGIFGPASINWRINRESALFLAAGRAALLQMAHPWVARALEEHSTTLTDPVRRFHNTFRVVFTMVFGTRDQAIDAARQLHHLHTYIRGYMPQSVGPFQQHSSYMANDVAALRWVFATLTESAVLAYQWVLPLTLEERETYYHESLRMAGLFGIPREAMPRDWDAFTLYNREMWASDVLTVSPVARRMGHRILHGAGSRIPIPFWYRALTAQSMPVQLRESFGLPYGAREDRSAAQAKRWLRRLYPKIPGVLRFVGPYREAQARLQGKRPGWSIRLSNRFWTGTPSLQSSGAIPSRSHSS